MTGSLQIKRDKYFVVLSYIENDRRKQKWIGTGLVTKGNKTRANEILKKTLRVYENTNMSYTDLYVSDYFRYWINKIEPYLSKSTYRSYKGYMLNHIIPYFESTAILLNQLKPYHLSDYYAYKLKAGKLSTQTIKHQHRIMSKALHDAVKREIIPMNPANNAETPKVQKFVGTFLNHEQLKELMDLVKGTILELPIIFLVNYGLRRSELLGLCWKHVDLINEQFTIANVLIQHPNGDYLKPYTKNISSFRTLPLTPTIKSGK